MAIARQAHAVVVAWERSDNHHNRGEMLLARTAAVVLGKTPAEVVVTRLCASCGSTEHGRPMMHGGRGERRAHLSLARTKDLVAVAVSTGGPVGIDVERVDALGFSGFEAVALHDLERAATTRERAIIWTRKESVLKATGQGLRVDPRRLKMSAPADPPRLLQSTRPTRPPASLGCQTCRWTLISSAA